MACTMLHVSRLERNAFVKIVSNKTVLNQIYIFEFLKTRLTLLLLVEVSLKLHWKRVITTERKSVYLDGQLSWNVLT